MLKVRRCHFAAIGNASARFSPLTLDFTDGTVATNGALFLENGGGKTTLAAFIYLTLWPEAAHFLLKKAKNPTAFVAKYLMPGQTAYVVIECETRVPELVDAPVVRVIGQILRRVDASERSAVQRHFFTFVSRAGLAFDDLPIHGIGGQSKSHSFEDFTRWLGEKRSEQPAAELWHEGSVENYLAKLREIHAEPDLARVQVDLNRLEGGIDDYFKDKCSDSRSFTHTLLNLALQSEKANATSSLLGKFIAEWLNVGHLEDETTFAEEFANALAALATARDRWAEAERHLRHCRSRGAGLRHALNQHIEKLTESNKENEKELGTEKVKLAGFGLEIKNRTNHVTSYELEYLQLIAEEAEEELRDAEQKLGAAAASKHLAELAVLYGDVERLRREAAARRRVLEEKTEELAPLLSALHATGATLHAALGAQVTTAEGEVTAAQDEQKRLEGVARKIQDSGTALAVERAGHEKVRSEARSFFEKRRYQREQLTTAGWLQEKERIEDALARWQLERETVKAGIAVQQEAQRTAERELQRLGDDRARTEGLAATAAGELRELRGKLDTAAKQRCGIVEHDLIAAHFGESFEPLAHGAAEELEKKRAEVFRLLLGLELDHAVSLRAEAGIRDQGVLPPTRDVEAVVKALLDTGVQATPALRYLAETCGREEAERLIAADPSRFAGVLVDSSAWEQVASVAWPEISAPVEVSRFPESFEIAGDARVVVAPTPAAFDKNEARQRALRLDEELRGLDRQITARRTEHDGFGTVAERLQAFLLAFGDGRLAGLQRDAQTKDREVEALEARKLELANEITEANAAKESARAAENTARERIEDEILPALADLEGFLENFEKHVETRRNADREAEARLAAIEIEEGLLRTERDTCERDLNAARQRAFESIAALQERRAQIDKVTFRDGEADAALAALPLSELAELYQQQLRKYEGQQDEEARVQLATAEAMHNARAKEFRDQLSGTPEDTVRVAAAAADFTESTLRSRRQQAQQAHDGAVQNAADCRATSNAARRTYNDTVSSAPEGGKRRFPEGEQRPSSSQEASALLEAGRRLLQEKQEAESACREQVQVLQNRVAEVRGDISAYEAQRNLLEAFAQHDAVQVELPTDLPSLKTAVSNLRDEESAAAKVEKSAREERDAKLNTAREVTVDARFTEKQVSLAKRYELYTPEQLLTHLDQERADLDQRIASNRDRIVGLKETREQLVHMMDGMSDEILSLLRSIDKVSRLPEDGMGAWNGKSFIRLTMHTPDETERQVTLRALLTEIVDSRRASSRTALDTDAASLVRLIADRLVCDKLIRVRILKPTAVRTETYEDVEMLRHYSGGEGVTVAILMYLTIVQMRAQHQHSTRRLQDAGFLLLDNPFGKCNREDLVRMHVHLAQQLRVQLIVMTGIRDPIILLSYPRRLRLVNDRVNQVTGAKHVRLDASEADVTAVENLRRYTFLS